MKALISRLQPQNDFSFNDSLLFTHERIGPHMLRWWSPQYCIVPTGNTNGLIKHGNYSADEW